MGKPPVTPLLCVDVIVVRALPDGRRGLLLVERSFSPLGWALPGGFVEVGEPCEAAALRELREETALRGRLCYQMRVYSDPARDKRLHAASVVFVADADGDPQGGDDARTARFWPLDGLPPLAFDHGEIVADYLSGRFVPTHAAGREG
jgi:8-oxo-dGTP diphosphatase